MNDHENVTGIILAGGKSRRMGADKGLVLLGGKPMVQYAIESLGLFCDRILISSNNPEYNCFDLEVIADSVADAGPMAGIASCLKQSTTERNLVLSCDMPLLDPVVLKTLLDNVYENTFVVPVDAEGRSEPLCAFYRLSSLSILEDLIRAGSFRMTDLFLRAPVKYLSPGDYPVKYNSRWFANINSSEDLTNAANTENQK
jgi:molybdopterin-guanine dinucleotide biosynthesis protein A